MVLACLEKGPGAHRPACMPKAPFPSQKEELKMKLKHNSIRSGSRVKSSALIVCWQALPSPQQTQCYQGTEGRFVCTGRAGCCVRPACPGVWGAPACTAKDQGCQGTWGGRQHPGSTNRELSPRTGYFGWRPYSASLHSSLARGDGSGCSQ